MCDWPVAIDGLKRENEVDVVVVWSAKRGDSGALATRSGKTV